MLLIILIGLTNCSEKDQSLEPYLTLSANTIQFSNTGGAQMITIKSNIEITVLSDLPWCNVTIEDVTIGSDGYFFTQLVVTVKANSEPANRSTSITINAGGISKTINVSQSLNDKLSLSKSNYEVSHIGDTIEIELKTTGIYEVSTDVSWIIHQEDSRSLSDKTESFIIRPNSATSPREGSISFKLNDISENVKVKQEANNNSSMLTDAMTMASAMTIGWNMGNSLESTDGTSASETMWGNPKVTKELINAIKAAGFNSIRIPVAWNAYIEDHSTHKISDSWLDRVEEVVNYCLENDMYTIINIHWDGGWLENNCTPNKQIENNIKQHALWTQIAMHFRDYEENLLFAGTNEPNVENSTQMGVLNSYLQSFIDAVRSTGGNNIYRNLIIQGPSTDIYTTNELMHTVPIDWVEKRLMLEIHYYSPWNFCGMEQDESWGKMFYFWGNGYHFDNSNRNADWGEEDFVNSQFTLMKSKFINKDIPVILGEYGAIKRNLLTEAEQAAHEASRLYYLEYVTRSAKDYGLIPFYWDNGASSSRIFNRNNNTIIDQQTLNALMNGVTK